MLQKNDSQSLSNDAAHDEKIKLEHIITADGSSTFQLVGMQEQYHSVNGAIQESSLVYIRNGYQYIKENNIKILEVGFGTGLNCLLTLAAHANSNNTNTIQYTALEPYPINNHLIQKLNYVQLIQLTEIEKVFYLMHAEPSFTNQIIAPNFSLSKSISPVDDYIDIAASFDLIYFDAFGPAIQPALWTKIVFEKMYALLKKGGILVTYCAKGEVKRHLKAVGFSLESLPGPPGKREITRAIK